MSMRYTVKDFRTDFPTDAACLAFVFKQRYPKGLECPNCGKGKFHAVTGRRSYACSCGFQTYPTEGTIFHKSPTPLVSWFHAMFLMSQSKNGVSAMEIMRQIGVTYKCAWRMAHQIRKLMKSDGGPLGGIVEADETYIGGKKKTGKGNYKGAHTPVFGMVERGGDLKAQVVPDAKTHTLLPAMREAVEPGTTVHTDEMRSYILVSRMGFKHKTVKHSKGEWVRGNVHTNTIEGFWGQLKRSITGTYCSVSRKHLPSYLNEFSFRYNHRHDLSPLPTTMFSKVGMRA